MQRLRRCQIFIDRVAPLGHWPLIRLIPKRLALGRLSVGRQLRPVPLEESVLQRNERVIIFHLNLAFLRQLTWYRTATMMARMATAAMELTTGIHQGVDLSRFNSPDILLMTSVT